MNKYQEALDYAKKHLDSKQDLEKVEVLQELVDKATPKKILRTVNDNGEPLFPRGYGECPKCKTVVGCSNKYCRECGQRLEW